MSVRTPFHSLHFFTALSGGRAAVLLAQGADPPWIAGQRSIGVFSKHICPGDEPELLKAGSRPPGRISGSGNPPPSRPHPCCGPAAREGRNEPVILRKD